MNKKIVIQDTADVIFTDIATGRVVLNAEAQLASISGAVNEEDLYGGIGNKKLFKIRSQKDINLSVRSAFASLDYWSMIQGVKVDATGEATVTKTEYVKVGGAVGALEVTISDTTFDNGGILVDKDGTQDPITFTSGVATVPVGSTLALGDEVEVFYQATVKGNSVKIDGAKFSNKWKCEMRTISYDPDTAQVYSDIYFLFPEVIPAGEFEISLENGTVYTPEIAFSVMTPKGSSELGEIIEVVRPKIVTP